jgi:general secretion pathway protein H
VERTIQAVPASGYPGAGQPQEHISGELTEHHGGNPASSSERQNRRNRQGYRARSVPARGFTLIELLVVMVIFGVTLGLVSLNSLPSQQQSLGKEAQRIALLLQLARDEAIVRNRQVAFEADQNNYRFLVKNEQEWQLIGHDDLFRQRSFDNSPVQLLLDPAPNTETPPLRITFGREPVDKPFVLTMASGNSRAVIRADGIGHFTVD